jgi:hypothetical protein
MPKTLWVQANRFDRKVILSEADQAHPGTHEIFIVGYEDPRFDADGNPVIPANPAIEVGDTPSVRQRIAEKDLIEVSAPAAPKITLTAAERERQAAERAAQKQAEDDRIAAEKAAADAAKGAK